MLRLKIRLEKIEALRTTATRLENGAEYNWSHQGNCNCGHLVQTVTKLSKRTIHRMALEKAGDWGEKVVDYCPTSNYPIDHVISTMLETGFNRRDLYELERLSAQTVQDSIAPERKPLQRNRCQDVILYMKAWADGLEDDLLAQVEIPEFTTDLHPLEFYETE